MDRVVKTQLFIVGCLVLGAPQLSAGKWGFADKEGGSKSDPVIEVSGTVAPLLGQRFSMTESEANALYQVDPATLAGPILFNLSAPPPFLPPTAGGQNQFIMLKFPMKVSKRKVRNSLFKASVTFAASSFLKPNISITSETGAQVLGIPGSNGKGVIDPGLAGSPSYQNLSKDPDYPTWLNVSGKNKLVTKKAFVFIADTDGDLSTIEAFADQGLTEVRVQLNAVKGVTINGFWVLKVGSGGTPAGPGLPTILAFTPSAPVTPAATAPNGNVEVESFSNYLVRYSEPMVPQSVGFSASQVNSFNASNPVIPMLYNGNTSLVPNPGNLNVPFYPNFTLAALSKDVVVGQTQPFIVPFDCRPINPNNLAEFKLSPSVDIPGGVDLTLTGIAIQNNANATSAVGFPTVDTSATTLYAERFDDPTAATASVAFRLVGTRAFTNLTVSPQTIYFSPLTGTGIGVVNLDGNGYETNDPSTEKLMVLTNLATVLTCPVGGSILFGCNQNTFGDATAQNPIGIGGNPADLMGPTPIPGVNEGSMGTTANGANPNSVFGAGFETVGKDSAGNIRQGKYPVLGNISDLQVGDFLDKIYFDTFNPNASLALHVSAIAGNQLLQNSISDPPSPNPPPSRLPVGLQPVDIVFNQQSVKKPAFVIEGDEVFSSIFAPRGRICLTPNLTNPLAGDAFLTFAQNGPQFQSFTAGAAPFSCRQQIGNYLYVADGDFGMVQVVNSNNMSVLSSFKTPDPHGLGLAPDLKTLYVSNYGDDTVSIISVDPMSPFFGQEVNRVKVGSGPKDVAVQPEHEDVFIANYLGNSLSILNPQSQTIRKTVAAQVNRPWEVVCTARQLLTGWFSGIYFAYVANQGTGDILVYESGPSGATGIGADEIRWSAQLDQPFADMRGICYDPGTYPGASTGLPTGVYVTHREADTGLAMISRVAFSAQLPGAGQFPPVPLPSSILNAPGIIQREFSVVGTWGGPLVASFQRINPNGSDQQPYDVCLDDFSAKNFFAQVPTGGRTNLGVVPAPYPSAGGVNSKHPLRVVNGAAVATWVPDRMYVSFPGDSRIEVLDAQEGGVRLNSVENTSVAGKLGVYFDQ